MTLLKQFAIRATVCARKYILKVIDSIRCTSSKWMIWGALSVIAVAAVIHSWCYADAIIDDAFITFRHALNIVRGNGYTCNPGERVEGTSSFLMTMISVVPIALGGDPLLFAKHLGALAFAGCTLAAYGTVNMVLPTTVGRCLGIAAAATVALSSTLAFHSQTGLETVLFALLVGVGLLCYSNRFVRKKSTHSGWAWIMVLVAMTRPEGAGYVVMLFFPAIICALFDSSLRKGVARDALLFLGLFGASILFRWFYFGELLPNSVLAKSSGSLTLKQLSPYNLLNALGYFDEKKHFGFLSTQAICAVLTGFSVVYRPTRLAGLAIMGIVAGAVVVIIWNANGSDWMPYHRLMTPTIAPLAVGAALGLRALLFYPEQDMGWSIMVSSGIFIACIAFAGKPLKIEVSSVLYDQARDIGLQLAKLRQPGDVAASDMGGILPYYWGIDVIDTMGLCNARLARNGKPIAGIGKSDPNYVVERRPTFYVFTYPSGAAHLFKNPVFAPYRDKYHLVKWPWRYYGKRLHPITILVRKDRPDLTRFAKMLEATLIEPAEEFQRTGFLAK